MMSYFIEENCIWWPTIDGSGIDLKIKLDKKINESGVTINLKEFTEPKHVERKTLEALNGYCKCNYKRRN